MMENANFKEAHAVISEMIKRNQALDHLNSALAAAAQVEVYMQRCEADMTAMNQQLSELESKLVNKDAELAELNRKCVDASDKVKRHAAECKAVMKNAEKDHDKRCADLMEHYDALEKHEQQVHKSKCEALARVRMEMEAELQQLQDKLDATEARLVEIREAVK